MHYRQEETDARPKIIRAGVATTALGLFALAAVTAGSAERDVAHLLWGLAIVVIVIGSLAVGVGMIVRHGRSIEEAYRLGYDVGYENGYKAGCSDEADWWTGTGTTT